MNESGVDMSPRRLSAANLQAALDTALREQQQLKEEIESLEAALAEKRTRLDELQGKRFSRGLSGIIGELQHELKKVMRVERDADLPSPVFIGDRRPTRKFVIEKITPKMIYVRTQGQTDISGIRKADARLLGCYPVDVEATEKVFKEFQATQAKDK